MDDVRVEWRVFFSPARINVGTDALLQRALASHTDASDLTEVWLPWGSRPLFVNWRGTPHAALNPFFAGARMRNRTDSTNRRYAYSLSVWVNFLAAREKNWDSGSENDVMDFKFWRRSDPRNPHRISGASWVADLAALSTFYDWAHRVQGVPALFSGAEHNVRASRYPTRSNQTRRTDLLPATVRGADVKWLSPNAYRRWLDVGIHGISPEGVERARWRPRSQSRDASFVEGLYGSGLRLQEWASVLTLELEKEVPNNRYATFRLSPACAKGGRGHDYWIKGDVLEQVATYREAERAAAVRAAQESALYERMTGRIIIEDSRSGNLRIRTFQGPRSFVSNVRLGDLGPSERLRLLVPKETGLEPAMLWLNQDGSPRQKSAWYKSFRRANARVAKAGIERLQCHPHMLRHSFALRWFAVGRVIWSNQVKDLDAEQQRDLRDQFGDTWSLVQTMLGHADVNTTKGIYLEPFQALQTRILLEHGKSAIDPEPLLAILADNPRVRLVDDNERAY